MMDWQRPSVFPLALQLGKRMLWSGLISSAVAGLLFVPFCTGIMAVIDEARFGVFEHDRRGQSGGNLLL